VIKIVHHRVSIVKTMFTYLTSHTTRCFYVVLFSTSWLSLSCFEVVRYGRIFQAFWFSICLSRIYCFTWAFQVFGTFSSPRATLHHASFSCSSTTPAPHWAIFNSLVAIAWDRHRNVLRPFDSLVPRHLKTYFKRVAAILIYAFIRSIPMVICSKEDNGTETCREYSFRDLPSDWKTQLSKTIYFLLAFVIPLMYMFLTYTKVAVSLWKRSKNGTIHGTVAECKVKSTRLMVVAVLGFVLCWGPTFWVELLNVYGVRGVNNFALRIWCYLAQISSSCLNPAIYAFFSPEFSKLVFKFCCCCYTVCGFTPCRHRSHVNQVQPTMWVVTKRLTNSFRRSPHHAQRIWKRWRHSENASNIRDITGLWRRHRFRKAFPSTRN